MKDAKEEYNELMKKAEKFKYIDKKKYDIIKNILSEFNTEFDVKSYILSKSNAGLTLDLNNNFRNNQNYIIGKRIKLLKVILANKELDKSEHNITLIQQIAVLFFFILLFLVNLVLIYGVQIEDKSLGLLFIINFVFIIGIGVSIAIISYFKSIYLYKNRKKKFSLISYDFNKQYTKIIKRK